jgi:hypothetical protein
MGGECSTHGGMGSAYKILFGKSEGKKHLEEISINGKITLDWTLEK